MSLKQIWHKITEIGVDESILGREVIKVRILNQLIFIAFTVSLINVPMYLIRGDSTLYLLSNLANVSLEAIGIYLAYKQRHKLARGLAVFAFPALMATHVIVHGLNFGSVFTTLGIMAFILYEGQRRVQIFAIFYICALFISSKLYVINTFDNTFQVHNYNELTFFPIILTALGLMLMLYQREIKKYEEQQLDLINRLDKKNQTLSQINSELEQFTYIASHDLKTPLRSISSHLDLIKIHLKRNNMKAVEKDLKFAKTGTKQMYALISDILEYKELNNNKENEETLDLNEILVDSLEAIDYKLKLENINIEAKSLPIIKGRRNEFTILFQNLIENGVKYNESKTPTVQIDFLIKNDQLLIQFKDNGIGIESEYHEKIFLFFKRLHRNEEYEGTGIGLGLCQKIILRYNGKIELKSTINQGSEFTLCLPLTILVS